MYLNNNTPICFITVGKRNSKKFRLQAPSRLLPSLWTLVWTFFRLKAINEIFRQTLSLILGMVVFFCGMNCFKKFRSVSIYFIYPVIRKSVPTSSTFLFEEVRLLFNEFHIVWAFLYFNGTDHASLLFFNYN